MTRSNSVWVPPSATSFSCLCETCLELARDEGSTFLEAIGRASVRGRLALETDVGFVRCDAGHEVVVRRVDRPAALTRRDTKQLELV
ncbi:MAG TPA: hypothetical protein VGL76_01235 [Gaiellaceae bacterium]